ncbi:hypothetical protein VOLCADRAFT_91570 [Volvox carteri f. nagariensis]|uniref:Uncharacterized protein n=1 Tax=Volvox carteri f. nagariensis TaxID=3068 RepID=D8TXF2_VOLCA|nr:uncharacterized protein VOLCADRAFT_91570 [Volvox carteri f. nagariensis]EFJ47900.1 hypothetical protein VOLCADRAFT_91570 [Volvox carteri f. nagariensis]|eukprot:XP_002951006.1 hypothetical protein VOLCADRAFT_91570 [Volvox carteri f. nagariensis]
MGGRGGTSAVYVWLVVSSRNHFNPLTLRGLVSVLSYCQGSGLDGQLPVGCRTATCCMVGSVSDVFGELRSRLVDSHTRTHARTAVRSSRDGCSNSRGRLWWSGNRRNAVVGMRRNVRAGVIRVEDPQCQAMVWFALHGFWSTAEGVWHSMGFGVLLRVYGTRTTYSNDADSNDADGGNDTMGRQHAAVLTSVRK